MGSNNEQLESPSEPAKSTTKINDLNDDCLAKIFMYLDLQNLFNVSIANEWLRPAAGVVYKRKFGAKKIEFDGIDGEIPRKAHSKTRCNAHYNRARKLAIVKENRDKIEIVYNLKMCLQYLRCFGSSITNLTINYAESRSKRYDYLHHYINKYCAENLIEISFHHKSNISIVNFVKPFVNVISVNVKCSDLEEQLPTFVEWFPNLHRLELIDVRLNNFRSNAPIFPHLKHLNIKITRHFFKAITNLLRSNVQLQTFEINRQSLRLSMDKLLSMIKNNPSIVKLDVRNGKVYAPVLVSSADIMQIIGQHPSLVELNLPRHQFTPDDAIAMISQHKSLEMFGFHMENYRSDYIELLSKMNSKWIVSEHSQPRSQPRFFVLNRKK